jgi:hypothetical protein
MIPVQSSGSVFRLPSSSRQPSASAHNHPSSLQPLTHRTFYGASSAGSSKSQPTQARMMFPNASRVLISGVVVKEESFPNTLKAFRLSPEEIDTDSIPDEKIRVFASKVGTDGTITGRLAGLNGKTVMLNPRSSLKPIQAILALRALKEKNLELTLKELAVLCASHDSLPSQTQVAGVCF